MYSSVKIEKLGQPKTAFALLGKNRAKPFHLRHTVNFCSEMGYAKHVTGKNIFCSMNLYKSRGKRVFEIVHWPFKLPPN